MFYLSFPDRVDNIFYFFTLFRALDIVLKSSYYVSCNNELLKLETFSIFISP